MSAVKGYALRGEESAMEHGIAHMDETKRTAVSDPSGDKINKIIQSQLHGIEWKTIHDGFSTLAKM